MCIKTLLIHPLQKPTMYIRQSLHGQSHISWVKYGNDSVPLCTIFADLV